MATKSIGTGAIHATSTVSGDVTTLSPGPFALEVYRQVQPIAYADQDLGYPLRNYIESLSQMFEEIDMLARSGWSVLLDLDLIPVKGLPWLGQFLGVVVDSTLTINQQKQQIRDHIGWARGRPEAIRKAVQPYLTGSKTVDIIERDTSPYHFEVRTYGDETPPAGTYQQMYNDFVTYEDLYDTIPSYELYLILFDGQFDIDLAIANSKPGALQYTFTVQAGSPGSFVNYDDLLLHNDTYQNVFDNYQTYDDVYIAP